MTKNKKNDSFNPERRKFLKQCVIAGCGLAVGAFTLKDLAFKRGGNKMGKNLENTESSAPNKWSKEAMWYELVGPESQLEAHCLLCPHGCMLAEGARGRCRTRLVKNGKLYTVAYGNACSAFVDPIEKKPLNHFLPGSSIFSIATAGCNFRCPNCQNWEISQARPEDISAYDLPPTKVVETAKQQNIPSIAYTYTDPIVYYEYTLDTAKIAKEQGLRNVLVTAGYINPDPLREWCKYIDAAHVDLKSFNEDFYKKMPHGSLAPVLKTIATMKELGVWVELIHLTIPTLSDNPKEIYEMSKWIVANVGKGTPLHLSRFHPTYKLTNLPPTSITALEDAYQAAKDAGLDFVYIGNVPNSDRQSTYCPNCKQLLIERNGYNITKNTIQNSKCSCGTLIPGIWS